MTGAAPLPAVSVVVPVHGVERYVGACIRSIQAQTLRDLEIIAVDDASPDGSRRIIADMAAADARIRLVVLERNVGQGFARNRGLERARGTYVWFLDADDVLASPRALAAAVERAERTGADMVRLRKAVFADGSAAAATPDPVEKWFPDAVDGLTLADDHRLLMSWNCWVFLYRRRFLDRHAIRFTLPRWEERPFVLRALKHAGAVSLAPETGVAYRVRAESTVRRSRSLDDLRMMIDNAEQAADLCDSAVSRHARDLVASQYLKAFFSGPWGRQILDLLSAGEGGDEVRRIGAVLARLDLRPERVAPAAFADARKALRSGCVDLALAAYRDGDVEALGMALRLKILGEAPRPEALSRRLRSAAGTPVGQALARLAGDRPVDDGGVLGH